MSLIKVKLNIDLCGIRKGSIIDLGSQKYPMTPYWKRRIRDSKIDNCLTIVKETEKKKSEVKPKKTERLKNGD